MSESSWKSLDEAWGEASWDEVPMVAEKTVRDGMERAPRRIKNLTTGEIYPSMNEAGRKLGFLSTPKIPPNKKHAGSSFVIRGNHLQLLD